MKKIVVNPKRVTAAETATQEYTTEEELLAAGYEALQINHKSAGKNYCLYRKMVNGKGDWYASDWNTRENVQHITYAQARGLEDINPTPVSRLGRELGKKLLPQTRVQSSAKPFKEGDKVKYMGKDTVVRKVEYDKQYGYDYLIDNPDWSEENYPNDKDGKFKKIWVGSEVTAATQLSDGFSPLDAAHYAIEKVSHMCRQIGKRKVGHIDIDDLSCSNDAISFDVILYTTAGRPFSQDTFSTSIHFDDANSENEDDVKWIIDNKVYEFAYNMIHSPVPPSRPTFGSKSVKAAAESAHFQVGDELSWSRLSGGSVDAVVTKVTNDQVFLDTSWTSEDDGSTQHAPEVYDIETDPSGRECIVVWRYSGECGYMYPPRNRVTASSNIKRTFIVQQYMKEEDENGPKFEKVHEADTHEAADEWLQKHLSETESTPSEFRIIQCSTITPKNAGLTSTVQKLINDKVIEIMQTDSFGFPADEAAEYSRVEVTEADHSYLRVEVRVELSYDSMWEMKELLDPIVSKMDQDAYFDMDEPGIMSAYVNINKLKAWGKDLANITGSESLAAASGCTMTIIVDQGLNADGFAISITDSLGQEVFKSNYMYGYNASWDKGWSSADKPYTTDIIEDLCSQYDVSNVEVVPGKNTFRGDDVRHDAVDRFKQNYLSDLSGPSSVTSASRPRYVYDPRIEPDDDYVEGDDYEDVLEIEVSTVVDFDEDGDTEYRDTSWARNPDRKDGDWHDDNGVYLADPGRVIEEFDELMKKSPDCPDGPGTYKVSGILRMKFIVTGVTLDEDSYEQEMVENYEGADADYDAKGSSIENLTFAEQTTVESATDANNTRRARTTELSGGYRLLAYGNGTRVIRKPHPYDDAEYYYAFSSDNKTWTICRWVESQQLKSFKNILEEDIDSLDDIVDELEMINAGIEPKMVHN